jgi:hypothetical protein
VAATKQDQILAAVLELKELTGGHGQALQGISDRLDKVNGSIARHEQDLTTLKRDKENAAAAAGAASTANRRWAFWAKWPLVGAGAMLGTHVINHFPETIAAAKIAVKTLMLP